VTPREPSAQRFQGRNNLFAVLVRRVKPDDHQAARLVIASRLRQFAADLVGQTVYPFVGSRHRTRVTKEWSLTEHWTAWERLLP